MKTESVLETVFKSGQIAVTGECGPPRGTSLAKVKEKAELLRGYVDAVNITDNQTAMVRMSSFGASLVLKQMDMQPLMQMVCRDRNRLAMQSEILSAYAHGINTMLCLSGDHCKFGDHPMAKGVFDLDSIQLIQMVRKMCDEGKFQGGADIQGPPKMFIGAAANPFADPFELRVARLAKKVKAGVDFIQTQCIFNIAKFELWMKGVRERGLHKQVYIMAGVTPIKSVGAARYMKNKVPGMDVPDHIVERMAKTPKDKQAQEGINICVESIQRLLTIEGVAGIHIMAIEWEAAVPEIVKRSGLYPRPQV
ncbi:MAG: methylenetetrahydrofolate reductase [Desulfobacterales bacterium]|nr:methylenetetrahydrofolate reductase [Desulfobacterales bacterium]